MFWSMPMAESTSFADPPASSPGPYDTFLTQGSRHRVYDAFELKPTRAVWLRFIAPFSADALSELLPWGVELHQDAYEPGDELLLTGVSGFFFPFHGIEVLDPSSGQPHIGNDHTRPLIEAIQVDQKSGLYTRDLRTGEAKLTEGPASVLLDPRREALLKRTVSARQWNLWVADQEPHRRTRQELTSQWAIPIAIPKHDAVMVTSASGQRVVRGPRILRLDYEETLAVLRLSTSTPKTDRTRLETCFLRTRNRVSDIVEVETSDFVAVHLHLRYHTHFDAAYEPRWFTHENYVEVLCNDVASRLRHVARTMTLTDFWRTIPQTVRHATVGEDPLGRLLPDQGLRINDVEIIDATILDSRIAALMDDYRRDNGAASGAGSPRQDTPPLRAHQARHRHGAHRAATRRHRAHRRARSEAR